MRWLTGALGLALLMFVSELDTSASSILVNYTRLTL